jgi:cellobiose phosphorylase
LEDEQLGGVHLNTDFHVSPYLALGRAFGFAYGTKENGAFFNHMSVMYAYALYKRGFVREGYRVLSSIYSMCADSGASRIYPGIPEYFDLDGRGHYHYLTGSGSWLVLVKLTEVFGVRGERGDLKICHKLVQEEFAAKTAAASVVSRFAKKTVTVVYENPKKLDYGEYRVVSVSINGASVEVEDKQSVKIKREAIEAGGQNCEIKIILG